jgi:hypothetical protein
MRMPYPLFEFKLKTIPLATAAAITMVVLLAANVTITNAQQQQQQEQQQLSAGQPTTAPETQNSTMATTASFESIRDSFRVQLPEGWVIQDVNNTGFTLAAEATQGYGILAQLCPEGEEGQQQGTVTDASSISTSGVCQQQGAQEEIIHIIRYPNLGSRLGIGVDDINNIIPASVIGYQTQKLQEVGYRNITISNTTNTRININYSTPEGVPTPEATVPARFIEMAYSTGSDPSELRRGYLILTATNVTPPNLETITGYSIFYEGGTAKQQTPTTPSGGLLLPAALSRVFNSFELIPSEEAEQIILALIAQQAMGNEANDQVEEDEPGEAEGDEDGDE